MKLLTKAIEKKLPKLYTQDGKDPAAVPVVVKFFTPWTNWTWYATEGEQQEDGDWRFFGYVVGNGGGELGYFTLNQLAAVQGPVGLKIERDRHFGKKTLAEVMR